MQTLADVLLMCSPQQRCVLAPMAMAFRNVKTRKNAYEEAWWAVHNEKMLGNDEDVTQAQERMRCTKAALDKAESYYCHMVLCFHLAGGTTEMLKAFEYVMGAPEPMSERPYVWVQ